MPKQPLSKNFTRGEFFCKCGEDHDFVIDMSFIEKLQKTRELYGKKMTITSGHRCAAWNEKQGGAKGSKHLTGEAADILVKTDRERGALIDAALEAGIRRIGIAKTFVHLDGGAADRVTIWLYI